MVQALTGRAKINQIERLVSIEFLNHIYGQSYDRKPRNSHNFHLSLLFLGNSLYVRISFAYGLTLFLFYANHKAVTNFTDIEK